MARSHDARSLRFARVAAVLTLCVACQGGYPIPPTRCDELCNVGAPQLPCQSEDPAGCVLFCQKAGGDAAGCDAEYDALLRCLQSAPAEQLACSPYRQTTACTVETNAFGTCGGHFSSFGPSGPAR